MASTSETNRTEFKKTEGLDLIEKKIRTGHLTIGSGIAGLSLALRLAQRGKVQIITKSSLIDNNSWHAQGGIASVLAREDSFADHITDTLSAGAGLCHLNIVKKVIERGPEAIKWLIDLGVKFSQDESAKHNEESSEGWEKYHLTREGGHSKRRVIHAEDITGREILRALIDSCIKHPNITMFEDQFVVDLIVSDKVAPDFAQNRCLGAYVLDRVSSQVYTIVADSTYLCTGGHGKAYLYTSNPDSATGDGLALAWRAGCRIANLEFMQFHPTCLYRPEAKNFLLSEALRGEGAILINRQGTEFVKAAHPLGSLAPRDVVARAIDLEIKRSGADYVLLDARPIGRSALESHFPNICAVLKKFGFDPALDPIPVVPAAHYSCGGVVVDEYGATNIHSLYALGEVACTGLHGANRLASNSLLEAVAYPNFVIEHLDKGVSLPVSDELFSRIPDWKTPHEVCTDEITVLGHIWDEIRRLMWNYVGIVRTTKRLERALSRISSLRSELRHYYFKHQVTGTILEVRNLADVAYLSVRCAMSRRESRGIHFTQDYPETDTQNPKDTILSGPWF